MTKAASSFSFLHGASSSSGARRKQTPTRLSERQTAEQWINVMVEFDCPADDGELTRGERYQRRRDAAQRHRAELEAWVHSAGLAPEVKDIGEATAFDLLFARVTPHAAAALHEAPGVVSVTPTE